MGNDNLKKWLRRLKKGDQSAFLPFYEKTAPGLLRFLLWKTNGDRATSEDILQEAYVKFLCHLDSIESEEAISVQSYLLRTVKNCLIDKVARAPHASRPHVSMDAIAEMSDRKQTSHQERAVELRELSIAMQSLSEKDSEIIWLRDALGMSHREVAKQVGITEQASRQAYIRAKRSLLSELSTVFPMPNGGAHVAPEMS